MIIFFLNSYRFFLKKKHPMGFTRMAKLVEVEEAARVTARAVAQEKRAALLARRARSLDEILFELRER